MDRNKSCPSLEQIVRSVFKQLEYPDLQRINHIVDGRSSIFFFNVSKNNLEISSFLPPFLHELIEHSAASTESAMGAMKSNEHIILDVGLKDNSSLAFCL